MSRAKLDRLLARARQVPGLEACVLQRLEAMVAAAERGRKDYKRFHWGNEPDAVSIAEAPLVQPDEQLILLGPLYDLTYWADKGGTVALWIHPFENPRPLLASNQAGRLVVCGGGYRITRRGIVG